MGEGAAHLHFLLHGLGVVLGLVLPVAGLGGVELPGKDLAVLGAQCLLRVCVAACAGSAVVAAAAASAVGGRGGGGGGTKTFRRKRCVVARGHVL